MNQAQTTTVTVNTNANRRRSEKITVRVLSVIQLAALFYLFVGGIVRYTRIKQIVYCDRGTCIWVSNSGASMWGVVFPAISAIAGLFAGGSNSSLAAVKMMIGFGVVGIFSLLAISSSIYFQLALILAKSAQNGYQYEHWSFDMSMALIAILLAIIYIVSTSFGCCCMDCCGNPQAATANFVVVERSQEATIQAVPAQQGELQKPTVFSSSSPPKYQQF